MHNANQKIHDTQDKLYLSWLEWKEKHRCDDTDESHCAGETTGTESSTTDCVEILTRHLSVCYYSS